MEGGRDSYSWCICVGRHGYGGLGGGRDGGWLGGGRDGGGGRQACRKKLGGVGSMLEKARRGR